MAHELEFVHLACGVETSRLTNKTNKAIPSTSMNDMLPNGSYPPYSNHRYHHRIQTNCNMHQIDCRCTSCSRQTKVHKNHLPKYHLHLDHRLQNNSFLDHRN